MAGAGTAIAAVLLTTPISGTASATETTQQASDKIIDAGAADQQDLACSVAETAESIELNATADKEIIEGADGDTEVIDDRAGTCRVYVKIKNTGEVPLVIEDFTLAGNLQGWHLDYAPSGDTRLDVGESQFINATLVAEDNAVGGQFDGVVSTSPAP